jgi:hypothetical protein
MILVAASGLASAQVINYNLVFSPYHPTPGPFTTRVLSGTPSQ